MNKTIIGGQAVIEGVMMRSPHHYSIAVRKPNNKITVKLERYKTYKERNKIWGWPFIRGMATLVESTALGSKAITYSANESIGDNEEDKLTKKEIIFTFIISIIAALIIFKGIPLLLANILSKQLGLNNFWFNLADGTIKILIFLGYLWIISMMKDVSRLFEYHGAEHMSVHCYEHDKKLTPENTKKYKTMHPRCGTEFLLLVIIISIIFYLFIPFGTNIWGKYLYRILLLPIIAGTSYEILRITGKYHKNWFFRIIAWPGMMLQKITTKKPDKKQLEVAIEALKTVLKAEKNFKKN